MTIQGAPTSYFSAPATELDPKLFQGRHLQSWVRQGIHAILNDFLGRSYRHSDLWAHPWLAGSGVSYQWSAARSPGDLDCLVGVDFVQFRKANPEFAGLTDKEIAAHINEDFRENLYPQTADWNGYELTFYVNPGASDIRAIKPYAAYDLKYDEWTVTPDPSQKAPYKPDWEAVADEDRHNANQAYTRFVVALNDSQMAHGEAAKRNAQARLHEAGQHGVALYNEIHENRSLAFSTEGEGYGDFNNYRWQAGKRLGTINALRAIQQHVKQSTEAEAKNLYGVELPDSSTLIRRAALQRKSW